LSKVLGITKGELRSPVLRYRSSHFSILPIQLDYDYILPHQGGKKIFQLSWLHIWYYTITEAVSRYLEVLSLFWRREYEYISAHSYPCGFSPLF